VPPTLVATDVSRRSTARELIMSSSCLERDGELLFFCFSCSYCAALSVSPLSFSAIEKEFEEEEGVELLLEGREDDSTAAAALPFSTEFSLCSLLVNSEPSCENVVLEKEEEEDVKTDGDAPSIISALLCCCC